MEALPAPLQGIADKSTHKERTQLVLNDIFKSGNRYDDGISTGTMEDDVPLTPYQLFCEWCKRHCEYIQAYSNNWDLAETTAPETSLWRKRAIQRRDMLWNANPANRDRPFSHFCSDRSFIVDPSVFWPWVSRTWRDAPEPIRDAFTAAATIVALAHAAAWVAHHWDTQHPQATDIEDGNIEPTRATNIWKTFGHLQTVGPLDPSIWNHPRPSQTTLAGWHVPLQVVNVVGGKDLFLYDSFQRVFFRVQLGTKAHALTEQFIQPIKRVSPVKGASPRTVTRAPRLPSVKHFSDDFLDSIAAANQSRTDISTIASVIIRLRDEHFLETDDDETAFIRAYRAFCKR